MTNFNPCVNGYLIIKDDGESLFFTNQILTEGLEDKLKKDNIQVFQASDLSKHLKKLPGETAVTEKIPYKFLDVVKKPKFYQLDFCILDRVAKNKVEIEGAKIAGLRDSKVLMNFFSFVQNLKNKSDFSEFQLSQELLNRRKKEKNFYFQSFNSIVAYGPNAAIVHYNPEEHHSAQLKDEGILLVDSGGQYLEGTTDITRTISLGKVSDEIKKDFTLVLKGHINLITAVFPEGTGGAQLDALARIYLWKEGKNYGHGTSHGVGSFLDVHEEGPVAAAAYSKGLKAGMIISIEPGFYKPSDYGIRIENLVFVKEHEKKGFLTFEPLSYVLIDEKLIDFDLLNAEEKKWLKDYNELCLKFSELKT